jgi:hypothetical protein
MHTMHPRGLDFKQTLTWDVVDLVPSLGKAVDSGGVELFFVTSCSTSTYVTGKIPFLDPILPSYQFWSILLVSDMISPYSGPQFLHI